VKITRISGFAAFIAAAAVVLTGCGSDTSNANSAPAGTSAGSSDAAASDPASSDAAASDPASSDAGSSAAGGAAGITFEAAGFTCATGSLASSGSTAQGKAIGKWIIDYNAKCGAKINDYGGGGSGKGISDFTAGQTDFGGSDSALKDDQVTPAADRCKGAEAWDLPMVTGPISVAYNLQGIDTLILTPSVISEIFGGTVAVWNDPKIAAINPGVNLPASPITTVHRQEESGTTDNFTKYLKAAGTWDFEGGKSWTAPGGQAAQGNDGVGKAVASTPGAIGYVEWGYAKDNKLQMSQIDNGAGPVELTAETAGKAVEAATISGKGNDLKLSIDYATKEKGAYPIILVTYEIVCSKNNGDNLDTLKSFLGYTATDGQASLVGVGAAPLPKPIQEKVVAAVNALG
jgi:phosphate transport system substrate-binding protein